MAELITLTAPAHDSVFNGERTEIATAIAAGGTTLVVDNGAKFSGDDYIVIGYPGTITCEIIKITSISSNSFTIPATKFAHSVDEPVVRTLFNQVRFLNATTETGSYSTVATVDMEVDNPDMLTRYSNTDSGNRSKYWKVVYYNATTTNTSPEADAQAFQPSSETVYCTPQDVSNFFHVPLTSVSRPQYEDYLSAIRASTDHIDRLTNSSWRQTTYTEYHDGNLSTLDRDYFLRHVPVVSITSISTTQADEGAASPTYDTLTVTSDYVLDSTTGRISVLDETYLPLRGRRDGFKAVYVAGAVTVPDDVRRLCTLITCRQLMLGANAKAVITGKKGFTSAQLSALDREIDMYIRERKFMKFGKN